MTDRADKHRYWAEVGFLYRERHNNNIRRLGRHKQLPSHRGQASCACTVICVALDTSQLVGRGP